MTALFSKLNLKQQTQITVLNAPPSFEAALSELTGVTVERSVPPGASLSFGLAFAITVRDRDAASQLMVGAAVGDATLWIAYPKATSKRYRCEFNRDTEWTVLQSAGYETVRMVAIDEDWSALRFRKQQFVKASTRAASSMNRSTIDR